MTSSRSIFYEASWLVAELSARSHILDALRSVQAQYMIVGQNIVELGCGIGTNLVVFAEHNSVLGVEGLSGAVSEGRRRGIQIIEANLEDSLPLQSGSADWILCIDVLEHLMNPLSCLINANWILRANGHLIVNVPNHFDWRGRFKLLRGSGIDTQGYFPESAHWAYPHVRFFTRASIEALLAEAGFDVIEDLAPRYLSFPKAHVWRSLRLERRMLSLQSRWPDLFSSGFFLVARKARHCGREP